MTLSVSISDLGLAAIPLAMALAGVIVLAGIYNALAIARVREACVLRAPWAPPEGEVIPLSLS